MHRSSQRAPSCLFYPVAWSGSNPRNIRGANSVKTGSGTRATKLGRRSPEQICKVHYERLDLLREGIREPCYHDVRHRRRPYVEG